jgi:ATP-dependent exoDNAse (exonuclease V) beta subunit
VPRHVIADGRAKYDRWQLARHDARAMGSVPSLRVKTVREWATPDADKDAAEAALPPGLNEADVRLVTIAQGTERPGGLGFGVLVHELLAKAPFDASRDSLDALAEIDARVLGMSELEAHAAARVAEQVLAHDLLARARAADARGACRRETPVTCTLPDGLLVEGIVDLAFEENGSWTVVDYKTDREMASGGPEEYRRQVALYASAIAAATGQPATGVLVRV